MITFLVRTPDTWPEAFFVMLAAAGVVWLVGMWVYGRRLGEEALRWAALLAVGSYGAILGSRLYMAHWDSWAAGYDLGTLPTVHGKNLLGAIAGTAVFTLLFRWISGIRARWEDAYGLALPAAIVVGRFACLFCGCCHGTVTSGWGLQYPPGSIPYMHHLKAGLIEAGASSSLAIHPAQLYEIAAMIPFTILVHRIYPRWKRRGSTFLFTIAGYGTIRFLWEFVRYGGQVEGGLKQVQWALLFVVVSCSIALWARERRSEAAAQAPRLVPSVARDAGAVLFTVGAALLVWLWSSPFEAFLGLLASIPLLWTAAAKAADVVLPRLPLAWRRVIPATVAAASLAGWTPLFMKEKTEPEQKRTLHFKLSGGGGRYHYQEDTGCGDGEPDQEQDELGSVAATVAVREHLSDRQYFEYGATAYWGYSHRIYRYDAPESGNNTCSEPDPSGSCPSFPEYDRGRWIPAPQPWAPVASYNMVGAHGFLGYQGYWFGIGGGLHVFGFPELEVGPRFMVSGDLRLLPTDFFFLKSSLFHGTQIFSGYPWRVGGGFTLGPLGYVEAGFALRFSALSQVGVYIEPHLKIEIGGYPFEIVPEFTFLDSPARNHSASLLIGISFPFNR